MNPMSFRLRLNPSRSQRGAAFLVIIIVVVIILVVVLWGGPLRRKSPQSQVTQAQHDLQRSRTSACLMNLRVAETEMTQIVIGNMGRPPTPEQVRKEINIQCPGNGVILMSEDGEFYCTEHKPPPPEILRSLMTIAEPTPVPTPRPLATAPPGGYHSQSEESTAGQVLDNPPAQE